MMIMMQLAGMGLDPGLVQQVVGQHRGRLEEVVRNLVEMQTGSGTSQDSIEHSILQVLDLLAPTQGILFWNPFMPKLCYRLDRNIPFSLGIPTGL